jgi:acyl carrier protein phosphodiesterase
MNYLAHIYLSGNNENIMLGNFFADSIHGSKYLDYPPEIQKGILLHRFIDSFTDSHPIYRQSKHRLHENYGHYSGVIMDIIYNHFLAKNWPRYSTISLENYADDFYKLLEKNFANLPERTQNMMPYMIEQNWLVTYKTIAGIEKILFQMDYRTKHRANMPQAVNELKQFYTEFESEFTAFFKELETNCLKKISEL